ncbi:hypothetical protein [Pseudomonas chlororaphis]
MDIDPEKVAVKGLSFSVTRVLENGSHKMKKTGTPGKTLNRRL